MLRRMGAKSIPRPSAAARRQCATTAEKPAAEKASEKVAAPANKFKMSSLDAKEKMFVCVIFAITGSSAVVVVRPTLKMIVESEVLGLPADSGFINGPWSFRFLYFAVMWPSYSMLLLMYGTIFGRREFFTHFVKKMWSRFLPPGLKKKLMA